MSGSARTTAQTNTGSLAFRLDSTSIEENFGFKSVDGEGGKDDRDKVERDGFGNGEKEAGGKGDKDGVGEGENGDDDGSQRGDGKAFVVD